MTLSVVTITKNEADIISSCLSSVSFADEIIIVDDNSTDNTTKIAESFGAKIFHRKLDGFATQKNFGIKMAKNDWILIMDADECLSEELKKEILYLKTKDFVAYSMPFKNYLNNKWLKHGGLYPDRHIRLFNRKFAYYGNREIHETLVINGKVGKLRNDVIHLTYKNYKEYLEKVRKYAKLEARWTKDRPKLNYTIRTFFVRYVVWKGFLDGAAGLISALFLAYYQYIIRKEMQRR